jgi:hypothetical protein
MRPGIGERISIGGDELVGESFAIRPP